MKLGTTSHPKFRSLQRALKVPMYAAVGLLESVWMLAAQFAEDGDISRFSTQEIADHAGYEGDANHLVETLIACRWLDRNDRSLTIHDWHEHRPGYLNDRDRKREKSQKPCVSDNEKGVSGTFLEDPGKSPPNPTQPIPTQPIPVNSIPSPPNPTQPVDWSVRWSVGVVKKSFVDSVVETANRFTGPRIKVGRELIWQACWIGCEFNRDEINDACDRMKIPGEVEKQEPYLKSIVRKLCEKNGEDWNRLRKLVPPLPPPVQKVSITEASVA